MNSTQSEPKTCANNVKCADNDYKLSNHIKRTAYERNATMFHSAKMKKMNAEKKNRKQIKKDDDKRMSRNESRKKNCSIIIK